MKLGVMKIYRLIVALTLALISEHIYTHDDVYMS